MRLLLVQIEETWGKTLRRGNGDARLIDEQVSGLLLRAFDESKRRGIPVRDALTSLLLDPATGSVSSVELLGHVDVVRGAVPGEKRPREEADALASRILAKISEQLQANERRRQMELDALVKEYRDEIRRVMRDQITGMFAKVEKGVKDAAFELTHEMSVSAEQLERRREGWMQDLERVPQKLQELQGDMAAVALLVERMDGSVRRAEDLQREMKALQVTCASLEGKLSALTLTLQGSETASWSLTRKVERASRVFVDLQWYRIVLSTCLLTIAVTFRSAPLFPQILMTAFSLGLIVLLIRSVAASDRP